MGQAQIRCLWEPPSATAAVFGILASWYRTGSCVPWQLVVAVDWHLTKDKLPLAVALLTVVACVSGPSPFISISHCCPAPHRPALPAPPPPRHTHTTSSLSSDSGVRTYRQGLAVADSELTPNQKIGLLAKKWREERNFWIAAMAFTLWW